MVTWITSWVDTWDFVCGKEKWHWLSLTCAIGVKWNMIETENPPA